MNEIDLQVEKTSKSEEAQNPELNLVALANCNCPCDKSDATTQLNKVADTINNSNVYDAKDALSKTLLKMDPTDFPEFLEKLEEKTAMGANRVHYDEATNYARLGATACLEPDYVIVTPGQTLYNIARTDLSHWGYKQSEAGALSRMVKAYTELNKLANPADIKAGSMLAMPRHFE